VGFLENTECTLEDSDIPNCYHFGANASVVRSPKIPVVVEGVRVPMIIDTGAEVSILSTKFMKDLFSVPDHELPLQSREVRSLGGGLVKIKGPIVLTVEVCNLVMQHPFYYYDGNITFLMGYDLISAAALTIDSESRCVWSNHTLRQDPANTNVKPTIEVNADSFLETVPQTYCSSSRASEESMETQIPDQSLYVSSSFSHPHAMFTFRASPSTSPRDDHTQLITIPDRVSTATQCRVLEEYPLVSLDPCAPVFTPSSSLNPAFRISNTEVVNRPPDCSECDVDTLDWLAIDPLNQFATPAHCHAMVRASESVTPQDRPPDLDFSATELKSVVDPSGSRLEQTTDVELPEHLNVLFCQTVEGADLSYDTVKGLKTLLHDHRDTFASSSADLGFSDLIQHDVDTGDARPIKQSPRRPPLAAKESEDEILNDMLSTGVIEPSNSSWASPVCLVKKKDGTFRFCIDYRRVNAVSKKDAHPIPDIQDALDHLRGAKYFATFDLLSGYWQLGLTERAKERSAFCTRRGLFHFTRMPFGLSGAPGSFCRLMSIVLRDLLWVVCLCYLDDIIIYGRTPEELLERLRMVLDKLRDAGLKLKPSKCVLFKTEIQYLGHLVSADGVNPIPNKIQALKDWPTPHCIRDVRAFFGLASYYRRFVKGFATIAEPLTRLTRKQTRFVWTEEAQEAFDKLKQALIDATSLAFPYSELPRILDTDASDVAIGAVLSQNLDGVERPIAFFSRVMNQTQRNYCTTRRELLAVISALQHFRHYLLGAKVILRTDHHSLKWLKTFKRPEGILARWVETLAEFDVEIEHRPGRLHSNVDGVSRPFCKQCEGKEAKMRWVDELERADELAEPLGILRASLAPEISDAEIQEMQTEDSDLGPVIEWLEAGDNPTLDSLKSHSLETRNLWAQVPTVHLLDGVLVRKPSDDPHVQLVVPHCMRKRLFEFTHAGPLAAHLGAQRTYLQLKPTYYWPGMRKDIHIWYRRCEICARSRGPPTRHHGQLQKVVTGAPLDVVAVDILSGLPTTTDGNRYILVLTDYFTKWACAFPLPDAEASTCMRAMYDGFFAQFGLPRQLHSDMGKNFESKLFHELCQITGITKSRTTPFHPQCDGQTERMNRTLLQMLRCTADDNPATWPQRLPTIMAAYRMTVHRVTGLTPNMAMLGREVMLPATLIAKPPEEFSATSVPFVRDLRDALRQAHQQVREATQSVARTQKRHYDERSRQTKFTQGQLVWLYWPRPPVRQKFKKLQQLWTGPWRIESFCSPLVANIKHVNKRSRQRVHIDRLAPCVTPPPSNAPADEQATSSVADTQPGPSQAVDEPETGSGSQGDVDSQRMDSQATLSQRPVRIRRRPTALEPYILG